MREWRCSNCGKLLARYEHTAGEIEIKCPRCREINKIGREAGKNAIVGDDVKAQEKKWT